MNIYEELTEKILEELRGRKEFRHLLEEIELEDPETYKEIKDAIENIIREKL